MSEKITINLTDSGEAITIKLNEAARGLSNILSIGTVTTGETGVPAAASLTGTTPAQTLNLTLPKGNTGAAATIAAGTTTTGAAGSSASVTNAGTSGAAVFNFTIPRGDTGVTGDTGDQGIQGIQGLKGDKGDQGDQGIQGIQGIQGDTSVIPIETVSATTRTVTPTDAGKKLRLTNASGCAITIQLNATAAFTVGTILYFRRVTGAGTPTIVSNGVTINSSKILEIREGDEFALQNVSVNAFDFI